MKFTKEEISLCKKIAERHRKEIEYGDWYYTTEFPEEKYRVRIYHFRWTSVADRRINKRKDITPLWTISDCLEFLSEKGWRVIHLSEEKSGWYTKIITYDESVKLYVHMVDGKTPLEACLKAALAVLEESK